MESITETEAYEDGKEFYLNGGSIYKCPYPKEMKKIYNSWHDGFKNAATKNIDFDEDEHDQAS